MVAALTATAGPAGRLAVLAATCILLLPRPASAAAGQPLASCIARERVAVTGTASTGGQDGRSVRKARSVPLAQSAEREVGAPGGTVVRIAEVPDSGEPAALKAALGEARRTGATMLMALTVDGKESRIGGGWITEDLGPIRTYTLRLQGTLADVRTGRILAFFELPPQPVAAASQEAAIHQFVEDSGYGVSQAIVTGMMAACEQRALSYEVAEQRKPEARPAPPAGSAGVSPGKRREKTGDDADPVTGPAVKPGRHRALVVGISRYQHLYTPGADGQVAFKPLKFADADAADFAKFLREKAKSGADWDVTLLTNEQATRNDVEEAVESIVDSASPTDVVMFFFSGHGSATGRAKDDVYLLTHDTNPRSVASGLHFNHLIKRMNQSAALQIVAFIDACRAGAAAGKGDSAAFAIMRSQAETEIGKMRMFFTAGQAYETTWESDTLRHGVFTHFLLEALERAPRTAVSGHSAPSAVTLDSIHTYVAPRVIEYTNNKKAFMSTQHPGMYGGAGMRNKPESWPLGFHDVH